MREKKRVREGVVVSNAMDKTVKVEVAYRRVHPLYGKVVKSRHTLMAHDAQNECLVGDRVRVVESRPVSKTKRWRVIQILDRSESAEV